MSIQREFRESAILLGLQSGAVAGMIERGSVAAINALAHEDKDAKQRKRDDDYQFIVGELQRIADEIAKIDKKIARLTEHIEQTKAVHDDLASGTIDVKAAMQTDAAKRAIQEWEKRTGKRFNPADPNAEAILLDILADQTKVDRERRDDWKQKRDQWEDLRDEVDVIARETGDADAVLQVMDRKFAEAPDSYAMADDIRVGSSEAAVVEIMEVEQDGASDEMSDFVANSSAEADFFSNFTNSALDEAEIKSEFSAAAEPAIEKPEQSADLETAEAAPVVDSATKLG